MAQDKGSQKQGQSKHFWYSIMPLVLTLLAIVFINWVWPSSTSSNLPSSPTAVANQRTTPSTTVTRSPILPATILPSPTPSKTPLPAPDTAATITLLGPPPESSLAANGRLTFYWAYSEPLLPGQQFVLILHQDETIVRAATINGPNLGSNFQLMVNLAELTLSSESAVWQVQLEWADAQQPLLTSEERTLILLAE